jgi:non-specific serine/threonine protein kinase
MFGRLQLLRLLGRSERTMAWRVLDARNGQELMLVLPRTQPADAPALQRWQEQMRRAARLSHPELAPVVETGVQDGWPYAAYELRDMATLAERLTPKGLPGADAAKLLAHTLRGLAYAHEAGIAHHDLQAFLVLVSDHGALRLAGLGVACEMAALAAVAAPEAEAGGSVQQQRGAAERDVLCAGLLLHGLLAGQAPLEEPDLGRVVLRLPPLGREFVRLPWTLAQPVAEPLRAIVNRATDRQERQRYRNARTLLRALEGWLQTSDGSEAGPLALLADKLRTAGVLPASPGAADRAARLALMEGQRTNELAEVVLQDLALSFELLRLVNAAQVRGMQVSGAGPVLTVRRAIAMLGLDGVRRAALALRPWPGPLGDEGAAALEALVQRCKRAGRLALALRPAGYDGEVVYLITLLQNLGRLVVQYHFPEETAQIRRLMQPGPPPREGEPEEPGMSEEAAAFAVLGADIEAIGAAVTRLWGLGDSVQTMVRRHPTATAVHTPESDDDYLRVTASCANEALDALALPPQRVAQGLQRVVQRYGRALGIGLRELQEALANRPANQQPAPIAQTDMMPLDELPPAAPGGPAQASAAGAVRAAAGGLRAAASARSPR